MVSAPQSAMPAYAGDVLPKQAWQALQQENAAMLVDVRTAPEWAFVGVVNLSTLEKEPTLLSWRAYPSMQPNPQFIEQLQSVAPNKATPLYFMCKLGGRSQEAAMAATAAGYSHAYNILHGFDGDKNDAGQRGTHNGWKAENLPWEQN